jgi:putative nucleotidyltransferase with HDIG domain
MTLGPKAQFYVLAMSVAGLGVLLDCIASLRLHNIASDFYILAALTLLSGSFTIKVPRLQARLSVSETFVFASVLLFGTCAGTVIVALDILVASLRSKHITREPIRVVFNVSSAATSIWLAGHSFFLLSGVAPLSEEPVRLGVIFFPLVFLAASYFVLNSVFVAVALALERGVNAFTIWRDNFLWLSVNYFGGASVAALLVSYTTTVDLTAISIIVPLLVISYLTFKTSFIRIDEANRHVDEVNRLYLSTIATLATAIDAKDQVTHGHIKRVQKFALGLARELGIQDTLQLKAIEAAALLHDTGKLVVPEHILNKPGKLTPGEFEKMKLHASAGADILSAIQFPYPVVPIVRHHHENWDGTGYPDGLRGTEIPVGARILAVVDCFDALTSDRPYRGALKDEDAMTIVMQRRATMYDPLVVDTFAAAKERLAAAMATPEESFAPASIQPENRTARRGLSSAHDRHVDVQLAEAARTVLSSIVATTGADLAIIFLKDPSIDELFCAFALDRAGESLNVPPVALATGVSGWVAATGRAILNADATLDFRTKPGNLALRRCVATPIKLQGEVVGVFACYMVDETGFTDLHLRLLEGISGTLEGEPFSTLIKGATSVRPADPKRRVLVH